MSAARTPAFGEVALELELRDFEPVPIRPSSKAPAPEEWQRGGPVAAWLPRYARCGTGLLTRRTPAVDIDVRHAEAADAVDRLAVQRLGDAPPRIGQPPKRLRLYQTDEPFRKVASRDLVLPGDQPGDKPHKVEVLAEGQQFVAFAIHPDTGLPYVWPDSSPLNLERQDLPEITGELAAAFVAEAEELLIRRFGARPKPALGRVREPARPRKPATPPRRVIDLGEARVVLAALDQLPNADLPYDDWIRVGYALKAALGEAGRAVFIAWSATSAKDDPDRTAKAWQSIRPERCGWCYLVRLVGGAS